MKKYTQIVIKIQALYFFLTGIWPLVHLKSFMAITGEKTDIWLVHMVGLLAMSIGINLYLTKRDLPLAVVSRSSTLYTRPKKPFLRFTS